MHVLYRFFDTAGTLLYVGITTDPPARFRGHRHSKRWWSEIATITLEHHDNAEALAEAERSAIWSERPKHNIDQNPELETVPTLRKHGQLAIIRCPYCSEEHPHNAAIASRAKRVRAACGGGWYRIAENEEERESLDGTPGETLTAQLGTGPIT